MNTKITSSHASGKFKADRAQVRQRSGDATSAQHDLHNSRVKPAKTFAQPTQKTSTGIFGEMGVVECVLSV